MGESGVIFRRVALSVALIIAMGPYPFYQVKFARAAAEDGQLAFNNVCRTCHTLGEGDNRLGPSLHKIIGRKAGSLPNYNYSSSMKRADLVWDRATLDRFISNPDQVIPGNNMKPYSGLTSAEERAKIVAFLEANGGD
jgi:cytochrome c